MPKEKEPQTNDVNNTLFAPSSKEVELQKQKEIDDYWAKREAEREAKRKSKNLYQKIQKAKVELQDSVTKKSGKNDYSKFDYLQLPDFLPQINSIFDELGLFSKFEIITETDENGVSTDTAFLYIINTDATEQVARYSSRCADAPIKGTTPVQQLGGMHTYMRRYLYMEALDLAVPDMLDPVAGSDAIDTSKKKITPKSKGILEKLCIELPDKEEAMLEKYKANDISKLTEEQALQAIRTMQIYQKKQNAAYKENA